LLRGKRLSIDGHKGSDKKRKKERKLGHGEILWNGIVDVVADVVHVREAVCGR
jgi:hypothetical protein